MSMYLEAMYGIQIQSPFKIATIQHHSSMSADNTIKHSSFNPAVSTQQVLGSWAQSVRETAAVKLKSDAIVSLLRDDTTMNSLTRQLEKLPTGTPVFVVDTEIVKDVEGQVVVNVTLRY